MGAGDSQQIRQNPISGGLIESGLAIQRVLETPYFGQRPVGEPGSWGHEMVYVGGEFDIVARKEDLE